MDCIKQVDRCMVRGTSDIFTFTLSNAGVPTDITGYTIRYTVRRAIPGNDIVDDTNAEISAVATITDASNGISVFNIPPADTKIPIGDYYYDIKVINPDDEDYIPVGGTLEVKYSITQDS